MALTNAQKQKAHRIKVNALRGEAARIHALLDGKAKAGDATAALLAGATSGETLSRLANDLELRFGASASA